MVLSLRAHSQICNSVQNSLRSGDVFRCPMVFLGSWAAWAQHRGSLRARSPLDSWAMAPGLRPPTPFPTKNYLPLHSSLTLPAPCHIHLFCLSLLPSLIVSQLGMGDQASWARARAWIMVTLSSTMRDKIPLLRAVLLCVWMQISERYKQ